MSSPVRWASFLLQFSISPAIQRNFRLIQNIASIKIFRDGMKGNPGLRFIVNDRPMGRRRSPIFGAAGKDEYLWGPIQGAIRMLSGIF